MSVIYTECIKCLHEKNNVLSYPKESDRRQRLDEESGHQKRERKQRKPFGVFPILSVTSLFKLCVHFLTNLQKEINL